jgi:predicted NUDIX family phosphoesterase
VVEIAEDMVVEIAEDMVVEIAEDMVVDMAETLIRIFLTQINPLEQKVGKIGVMEILLKTLNLKVVEVGEKEEFQMKGISLMRIINSPFL